uniref:Uncharacterized protein n=1 Tax=Parascaris univalens TaxID=6257 RepID=A0A915A5E4_PARUN
MLPSIPSRRRIGHHPHIEGSIPLSTAIHRRSPRRVEQPNPFSSADSQNAQEKRMHGSRTHLRRLWQQRTQLIEPRLHRQVGPAELDHAVRQRQTDHPYRSVDQQMLRASRRFQPAGKLSKGLWQIATTMYRGKGKGNSHLRNDAKPVFRPRRSVPYAAIEAVEQELSRARKSNHHPESGLLVVGSS